MNPHSIGNKILPTKLDRIETRSRENHRNTFNNLGHVIDLELLRRCHHKLDGKKACGIDKVTKTDYENNLEENIQSLLTRVRKGNYHPKPARIVQIPKADGGLRPLAISCHEDKIVQEAVRQILERIYEPIFLECSHGFRPKRGTQTALVALDDQLMDYSTGAVLEIDLRKYFDSIPHEHLRRFLEMKISDNRFLHLILKLTQTPTYNEDGEIQTRNMGCPQGSILSPILANIYLHYVLDIWLVWRNAQGTPSAQGKMTRYADDVVFCFKYFDQAEKFKNELQQRLERFGITIHEGKTQILINGRKEATLHGGRGKTMPVFTFLGFLHVWGKGTKRWACNKTFWRLKRITCPIRYKKKLKLIKEFIQSNLHKRGLIPKLKRIVQGYLAYFAINDNGRRTQSFIRAVRFMLFKYLNKRSQRKSYNWETFAKRLNHEKFPERWPLRSLFFNSKQYVCG